LTAVAVVRIVLALLLLVVLRWPAIRAMPVCAAVTGACAYLFWQMPAIRIVAAIIEGAWVTASILLIIFGAMFFLALLRRTGATPVLQRSVGTLSPDGRIQAVLVGWCLGSFLEGAAGFGTPAAITAPLLIGLGFRPVQAVMVALIGDSTAVSFGAVGTPMIIGMGQGLTATAGSTAIPSVDAIGQRIATFDLVLGTIMPAILVLALTRSLQRQGWWRAGLQAVPFALCVGLAQAVTSWAVAALLGPEFPSLLGSLAGFLAGLAMLRSGCLVPREVWRAAAAENGEQPMKTESAAVSDEVPTAVAAFAPYFLLLTLLVISRSRALPFGGWLSSVSLGMSNILETGISSRFEPLYSPGLIFVVCALISAVWLHAGRQGLGNAARDAGKVTLQTAVALISAIIMVRIFIQSGDNSAGLPSMPVAVAETLAHGLGDFWPAVAPWVGALGSFVSGSATFSNMLFALLQLQVATDLNHSATSILALQGVGAAAGNMVCIHNVVAACAVTGILGEEGNVIRRTALPLVVYLFIAGLLGMML